MTTMKARRVSRRTLLLIIAAAALCAWGGLLLFTYYVSISGPAIFVVFVLLALALFCTCTLLIYLVSWLIHHPGLVLALRESGLISTWLLFNLLLNTLRSWSLFSAIVSFGIIVIIEILVLGRS